MNEDEMHIKELVDQLIGALEEAKELIMSCQNSLKEAEGLIIEQHDEIVRLNSELDHYKSRVKLLEQ